ncbi:lysozyme inhibitor LprI family protein [Mesorhizobium sp. L2C067A000]|uniref:lysozyme inhibitor LprI family protein n=1 Tax=Mesorhizobium sp. L2C067A000 TaxID=1287106 RepID=UPI0003CFE146|nr:lysozyme inhibitor LprI family protein [Mesorhizobium sp. L2C067A000]ESZ36167.1 hypothetical protein X733_06080 [Mesorhizobium sp. L2C067A000]
MGAVLTVFLAASDHAAAQGKPSFDCAKAASVAEKAICADPTLAQADADVAKNYAALLKRLDAHAGKALRDDQSERDGDALVVEQSGAGKDGRSEPLSCGANGHADGTFFLTEKK